MATLSEIEKILNTLEGANSILQVLKVDPKLIIQNYAELVFDKLLSKYEVGSAEYNSMLENLVTYFVSGQGKQFMQQNLAALKQAFLSLSDMLKNIHESFAQFAILQVTPSVLTVGSATSSPNPGYSIVDNLQRVRALKATINVCNDKAIQLLNIIVLLRMESLLPPEVLDVFSILGSVNNLLNSI